MKKLFQPVYVSCLVAACVILSGCETAPKQPPETKPVVKPKETPKPAPAPTPVEPPAPVLTPDAQALKDGMALYDNGDYNGAIKKLAGSTELWSAHNKDVEVTALKIMAFSYCVTSRKYLCYQQFDKAFRLDPNFDLSASEIGHPIWGPVFQRAKNAARRKK